MVLLTDGQNNRGAIDPLTGADLARAFGIKVYTVLVGRGGVVPVPVDDPVLGRRVEMVRMDVDEGTLREIAQRTGGRFFRAHGPGGAGQHLRRDRPARARADPLDRVPRVPRPGPDAARRARRLMLAAPRCSAPRPGRSALP